MSQAIIMNSNIVSKSSVYPKTFYPHSFLPLTSTSLQNLYHFLTRKRCKNCYTLKKEGYLHCQGIATCLYSQLSKLLLMSRNKIFPGKNLINLKQVYTFQFNQRKFKNPKSSQPLKRFCVHFLTTLNPIKQKVT